MCYCNICSFLFQLQRENFNLGEDEQKIIKCQFGFHIKDENNL